MTVRNEDNTTRGMPAAARRGRTGKLALALSIAALVVGLLGATTPAVAHVGGTVSHLWNHLRPKADDRYANAVAGTDKARNADTLDGLNSTAFQRAGAKAADAELLDGLDSSGFVQGEGRTLTTQESISIREQRIVSIPDLGTLTVSCEVGPPAGLAMTAEVPNPSASFRLGWVSIDGGAPTAARSGFLEGPLVLPAALGGGSHQTVFTLYSEDTSLVPRPTVTARVTVSSQSLDTLCYVLVQVEVVRGIS